MPRQAQSRAGQSTVEYVLVLSVLVVAMWAAAQLFVPDYAAGLGAMQADLSRTTRDGVVGGS
ncbi:MAG: hypothetical protein H6739_18850 [Alphaproteobacteria bacterium]|nr:hypothetical protein [Alphaproteobacteria bacterium]